MNYYPALISTAFASVERDRDRPQVARAVSTWGAIADDDPVCPSISFELLPEGLERKVFVMGDMFLNGLSDPKVTDNLDVAFVLPPFGVDRDASWYPMTQRFGMINLVLAHLMGVCENADSRPLGRRNRQQELFPVPGSRVRTSPVCMDMPIKRTRLDALVILISQPALRQWAERQKQDQCSMRLSDLDLTFVEHAHDGVAGLLELPEDYPTPFVTMIARRGPGCVRFMKITDEIAELGPERIGADLTRLLALDCGKSEFGYVSATENGTVNMHWWYDAESDETAELIKSLEVSGKVVPLSEVARIWCGGASPQGRGETANNEAEHLARIETTEGSVLLLNGDTVRRNGNNGRTGRVLEEGDICISKLMTPDQRLQVGVYQSDGRPLNVSRFIAVVRLDDDIDPRVRQALIGYLQTHTAYRLAKAKGAIIGEHRAGVYMLQHYRLADLPVPLEC